MPITSTMTSPNPEPRPRNCRDCRYCAVADYGNVAFCEAPQLSTVLDGDTPNTITFAEGVRDFKCACGHAARWFVPRDPSPKAGGAQQ